MPSFLHPALFWTLGLPTLGVVAIPVLIHLINMMRHRRIAMGGDGVPAAEPEEEPHLGHAQATVAAVAADAGRGRGRAAGCPAGAAKPVGQSAGRHAHPPHRAAGRQLLDVRPLGRHRRLRRGQKGRRSASAPRRPGRPIPRSSRSCGSRGWGGSSGPRSPICSSSRSAASFADKLGELLAKIKVTQTAAGPMPALQAVAQLLGRSDGERRVVYLVSDFRARQWDRSPRNSARSCGG